MLSLPVVSDSKEPLPTAVIPVAVVAAVPALPPIKVLFVPVVNAVPATLPTAVLKPEPVVILKVFKAS